MSAMSEFVAYIKSTAADGGAGANLFEAGATKSAQPGGGQTMQDFMDSPVMVAARRGGVAKILIDPSDQILEAGGMALGLTAVAVYRDGSRLGLPDDAVTWSSSKSDVAHIDKNGRIVTEYAGVATISAQHLSVTGTTTVTVKEPRLVDLRITPENPAKVGGGNVDFQVAGIYENLRGANEYKKTALPKDLKVEWKSSAPQVATIDQAGHATIKNVGKSVITATVNGVSKTTTLTVTPQGAAAQKIRVEINVHDANGAGINGRGIVVFRHDPCPQVEVEAEIRGGYFSVEPTIVPHGNLEFRAANRDKSIVTASGSVFYDLRANGIMQFTADQKAGEEEQQTQDQKSRTTGNKKTHTTGHTKTKTTSHKTGDETEDKTSDKGHFGIEVDGLGGGIEVGGEHSNKHTKEDSEENSEQDSQEDSEERSEENTDSRQKQVGTKVPFGLQGFDLKQIK
jgi:hypothetical protein